MYETRLITIAIGLALASGVAHAQGKGTITGTVTAAPAKYLPDTVVYLKSVPGTYPPRTVEMDQRGMRFVPHILTITVGDSVKFLNSDPIEHNVHSPDCGYDLGNWGQGASRTHRFDKVRVCTQLCSLHPDMLAYVFVGQNPYAAVVGADGHFTIPDVPPGSYELDVWNATLHGTGQKVTVTANGEVHATLSVHR